MKLGSDFELPLVSSKGGVPAHLFFKGTKHTPEKISHGWAQYDNAMMELNIPVADNRATFIGGICNVLREAQLRLPPQVSVMYSDYCEYPVKALRLPQLKEFGCMPDVNAFTGKNNPRPVDLGSTSFRTAGFHIHIDFEGSFEDKCKFIQVLEYLVQLRLMRHEEQPSKLDWFNRRVYYGKAGSFRPKKYGVEWRTLSSNLLRDKKILNELYSLLEYATNNWHNYADDLDSELVRNNLQSCINNHDTTLRDNLLEGQSHA